VQACRLTGLAGARCGRLRDGRGVRNGLTSRVMASREESYLVFLPSSAGILDSCVFFCPQQYEILYLRSDDEMSHLTAKNSQKHEVDIAMEAGEWL